MVQRMMHALKYQGREDIARYLGDMLGEELRQVKRFGDADLVVPVPLHGRKLRSRGYNQASAFGQHLSKSMGIPFLEDALERTRPGTTQTRKSRVERNRDLKGSFCVSDTNSLINKHVLLVDDIITSGATLEVCARKILEIQGARVSLASIAFTL